MKKMLVPTDFSIFAQNALKVAFQLARKTEADITLLHVMPPLQKLLLAPEPITDNNGLEAILLTQVRKYAEKQLAETLQKQAYPAEKIHLLVQTGDIAPTIVQMARDIEADMIVMGTQGTRPLEEVWVGSNAEKVVRLAPCPVLTVRDHPQNFIMAKILFPTDLKKASPGAIIRLRAFQGLTDAHLHLLFINSRYGFLSQEEIERRKAHFVLEHHLDNYTFHSLAAWREESGILMMAQKLEVDMIALITHQRQGLYRFFLGSTAEEVVNHSQRPVLTLGASLPA
ncbi:MAG: universal stress protein [Microscillaceae bacterium]|nr:universal stress protein [Microscillaceae bacterium]